jgi:3-oxoadipate enol-lactonase
MIHAGIADRSMWDPQWARWTKRYTLIRYDLRGWGESADPEPGAEWTFHGDALAVLEAAGHSRAAVIGCSLGAEVAFDLAVTYPEAVGAIVAVSGGPTPAERDPELARRFAEIDRALEGEGADAANELELRLWMDGTRPAGSCDAAVRARIGELNSSLLIRQRDLDFDVAEPEPPAIERLSEIHVPVVTLAGERDHPSIRSRAERLRALTGASHAVVPGAAHLPSLERPAEFDAVVLPFLARLA